MLLRGRCRRMAVWHAHVLGKDQTYPLAFPLSHHPRFNPLAKACGVRTRPWTYPKTWPPIQISRTRPRTHPTRGRILNYPETQMGPKTSPLWILTTVPADANSYFSGGRAG